MSDNLESRIAVCDTFDDDIERDTVIGKHWYAELFELTPREIDALRDGKYVVLDILNEYVAFLALKPNAT